MRGLIVLTVSNKGVDCLDTRLHWPFVSAARFLCFLLFLIALLTWGCGLSLAKEMWKAVSV